MSADSTLAFLVEQSERADSEPVFTTIIEPRKGWVPLNLKALWRYRELLYFLTWRDVKVRYKQTVLGAAWAVDNALQMTMAPNLRVMTSGPQPPNPAELLASQSMIALLRDLEARADLVIFDTPHMGPLTDAVVLSARVSGTLLAVRAGSTRRTVITNSLNALRKVGGNVVGTVLNVVEMKPSSKYSYYDYQIYTAEAVEAAAGVGPRGA